MVGNGGAEFRQRILMPSDSQAMSPARAIGQFHVDDRPLMARFAVEERGL